MPKKMYIKLKIAIYVMLVLTLLVALVQGLSFSADAAGKRLHLYSYAQTRESESVNTADGLSRAQITPLTMVTKEAQ